MAKYIKRGNFGKLLEKHVQQGGKWHPIIDYVNKYNHNLKLNELDKSLDLHLRGNCIHIYYKGGRILEIKTNVLNIDKNYFYKSKDYYEIPRTHISFIAEDNIKELEKRNCKYQITKKEAISIFEKLKNKRDQLMCMENSSSKNEAYAKLAENPQRYFDEAMSIMDEWSNALEEACDKKHEERLLQQKISVANNNPEKTDFVVLDIEFAVTKDLNVTYSNPQYYQPRFDIIALIPNNGNKLAVIELKKGLGATGITSDGQFDEKSKSGVADHKKKFLATIGSDAGYQEFIEEMQFVLKMKVDLGVLPKNMEDVNIKNELPDFYIAYAGEEIDKFNDACKNSGLNCLCIYNENEPILRINRE